MRTWCLVAATLWSGVASGQSGIDSWSGADLTARIEAAGLTEVKIQEDGSTLWTGARVGDERVLLVLAPRTPATLALPYCSGPAGSERVLCASVRAAEVEKQVAERIVASGLNPFWGDNLATGLALASMDVECLRKGSGDECSIRSTAFVGIAASDASRMPFRCTPLEWRGNDALCLYDLEASKAVAEAVAGGVALGGLTFASAPVWKRSADRAWWTAGDLKEMLTEQGFSDVETLTFPHDPVRGTGAAYRHVIGARGGVDVVVRLGSKTGIDRVPGEGCLHADRAPTLCVAAYDVAAEQRLLTPLSTVPAAEPAAFEKALAGAGIEATCLRPASSGVMAENIACTLAGVPPGMYQLAAGPRGLFDGPRYRSRMPSVEIAGGFLVQTMWVEPDVAAAVAEALTGVDPRAGGEGR